MVFAGTETQRAILKRRGFREKRHSLPNEVHGRSQPIARSTGVGFDMQAPLERRGKRPAQARINFFQTTLLNFITLIVAGDNVERNC